MAKRRRKSGGQGGGVRGDGAADDAAASRPASGRKLDDGLPWLLDGADPTDFQKKTWEREPLHLSGRSSSHYGALAALSTPEALFKLMDAGVVPVYRVNMFRCVDGSTKEEPRPPPASVADVRRLFKAGWSIQWLQPQQESDELAKLVAVLESQLGSLVGVNAYLTPPGVQGLAPHWDDVEVFILQLSGTKSWTLHKTLVTSPLPPEAQTLPRYTSGDLPLQSLGPAALKPVLAAGDLLYFPRGTIHYAPNFDSKKPSVHLTISTYQRQTLFDLTSKVFEEGMSVFWEEDEALRRALPWGAFYPGAASYPKVCSSVAAQLRRLADEVAKEAERAARSGSSEGGAVAASLAELGADFVKHRMPPSADASEDVDIVGPESVLVMPDPSLVALSPVAGSDDGSIELVHCLGNSRRSHMMNHPEAAEGDGGGMRGEGGEEGGESEMSQEEDEEEGGPRDGMLLDEHAAAVLRELCAGKKVSVGAAGVPKSARQGVCGGLTQLVAMGLVKVVPGGDVSAAAAPAERPKKRKKGS